MDCLWKVDLCSLLPEDGLSVESRSLLIVAEVGDVGGLGSRNSRTVLNHVH